MHRQPSAASSAAPEPEAMLAGAPGSMTFFTDMHLLDYGRVLYRRRWLAAAVVLVALAGVGLYTVLAVPLYDAQATVLIEPAKPNVVTFQDVLNEGMGQDGYLQTQVQLLTSRALAQRTVAALRASGSGVFARESADRATDALLDGMRVLPLRGSRMVAVRFRSPDAKAAAAVANAHAAQYIQQSLDSQFRASKDATAWLDTQLAEERAHVERSESALQAYREQHDALSLTAGQDIVVQKLAALNAAVTRAKAARIEKESQYREVLAIRRANSLDALPAILSNPFIQQLKGDLARLQREYSQLAETLGERHPTLVAKRTEVETTDRRLTAEIDRVAESLRNAYAAAQAEEDSLGSALEAQKREALALNRRGIEYAALEREAQSVRQVYQALLQRAKETKVSGDLKVTNLRIVDPARVPTAPASPRPALNLLAGLVSGILLAVGLVFGLEYFDDRARTPEDIRTHLRMPVLGLLPQVVSHGRSPVVLQPGGPPSLLEGVRALRTSVMASSRHGGPRSILVASASEGEGKSFVASSLAIALAQAHETVLLIDADMRRPELHTLFGHRLAPGLADVLGGDASVSDILRPSALPGLTVTSAGSPTTRAPELLGSPRAAELFDVLRGHFAWVIVDSPPALSVTDASVLARYSAGVLFAVASGITSTRAAKVAIEELEAAGAPVLGVVLTRADLQHHPLYFSPYSRGEYRAARATSRTPRALIGTGV